jgi:peptidoglycan/LPS O-acetylase OafA/YrhL
MFLGWLAYYLHSFRLEVFFLMAGFFAVLVIERRGAVAYARDRAWRILLVFVVWLYPMKVALTAIWIWGGLKTGWLPMPGATVWQIVPGALKEEVWPGINLTHLWFLYYLAWISGIFLGLRALLGRVAWPGWMGRGLYAAMASRLAPLWWAVVVTPIAARMQGMDIDTPDKSLAIHVWALLLYGLVFCLGAWLYRHTELLAVFAARWKTLLVVGLVVSFVASIGVGMRYSNIEWVRAHSDGLRWATSFGLSLSMGSSVLGWLGCFVALFRRPSARVRYVADASYWIYVAHLPLVVAMQVGLAGSGAPWWVEVPLVMGGAVVLLLAVYHVAVRETWVGTWLRGRRLSPEPELVKQGE